MWSRLRNLALLAVVGTAALLPLYGDPRPAPVTHTEWARMVLRALDLLEATEQVGDRASQAFQILSWKNSLLYRGDRYMRSQGVELLPAPGHVRASAAVAELAYPVAVVRGGDYRLRLRLAGNPESPAEAEITRAGDTRPTHAFRFVPAPAAGWVDGGGAHLDPGGYAVTVLLAEGTTLEFLELAPPCLAPVEPLGGWSGTAVASTEDVAVTVLQALDVEHELPPAAAALERVATDFQVEGGRVAVPVSLGPAALELKAGPGGLRAVGTLEIPETGLYALSVFGERGQGHTWLADACRKAVLCPDPQAAARTGWWPILTGEFAAGRHFLSVTLGDGAAAGRVRAEKKKAGGPDYVATLRRLGFDPGPEGPIARGKAVEAMRFIERRRALLATALCGEIVLPQAPEAGPVLVAEAQIQGPSTGGAPPTTTGPGEPPIGPPAIPPQVITSPTQP